MAEENVESEIKLARSFGTHDGGFHADDVTACALLLHFGMIDKRNIIRSRDLKVLQRCEYVCDVGGVFDGSEKRFDHHQSDYTGHYSSAGMTLNYLFESGEIDASLYDFFRYNLIDGVDAIDIGAYQPPMGLATYSQVIAAFMPPSYEATESELMEAFYLAVDFACAHLKRIVARFEELARCKKTVCDCMKISKDCLYFEHPMPWIEAFFANGGDDHPAKYIIMPARGKWKLRGIPPTLSERMKVRKPLPESWAGLLEADLKRVTGISGAVFCHKGLFISIWDTLADAKKALEIAMST